jgi:ABC-type glycerol-3-phosphate transport system substrate-binding protein
VQSANCWSWGVSANSANVAQAKDLIRYVMAPDRLEQVYEKVAGRWYPVYRDLTAGAGSVQHLSADHRQLPHQLVPGDGIRRAAHPAHFGDRLVRPAADGGDVTVQGMNPEQAAKRGQEQMEQLFA